MPGIGASASAAALSCRAIMIFLALIVVLAAWLAFVWIVEPDHFMRRTSKRMVKPPLPPPDNKNGASNMYTVYYGLPDLASCPLTAEISGLASPSWTCRRH